MRTVRDLGRAGLVESVRGAGGGYRFSGNAKRATLFDVIQLFEDVGPECDAYNEPGDATEIGQALCAVMLEIDRISQATLKSVTIDTLLKFRRWQQERQAGAAD